MSLEEHLRIRVDMQRQCNEHNRRLRGGDTEPPKYECIEDFVLKHGCAMPQVSKLTKYMKGEMKMCFMNAFNMALFSITPPHEDLIYCEGYAYPGGLIPVHHAWIIDTTGVIDPTWGPKKARKAEYFGVAFETEFVKEQVYDRGAYGILDNFEKHYPILTGKVKPRVVTCNDRWAR